MKYLATYIRTRRVPTYQHFDHLVDVVQVESNLKVNSLISTWLSDMLPSRWNRVEELMGDMCECRHGGEQRRNERLG